MHEQWQQQQQQKKTTTNKDWRDLYALHVQIANNNNKTTKVGGTLMLCIQQ